MTDPHPSNRKLVYTLVMLAIPVLFFVLVEGVLRLTGGANDYPLFIPHPQHPDYLLANPQVIKRYFGDPEQAPSMKIETVFFRAKKSDKALRIFVQGGSSAAGFPYGFGGSLTGMLEQRLRRVYPNREIEVINTAMSAVNTYTLLDFADEIIDQQPDAVLVYAGHNEYLGILGVGSSYLGGHSLFMTRAYVVLRDLRLFQLLQKLYAGIAPKKPQPSRGDAIEQGTMMSRVAAEQHIAYGSKLYQQGVAQFDSNLSKLIKRYSDAGIPVYVGTLVSNEKSQPPFNSGLNPATNRDDWRQRYAALQEMLDSDQETALASAQALVSLDDRSADAWFAFGAAAYAAADYDLARQAYQAARDRDELRFRAPSVFNDIIANSVHAGARLVDVDQSLRQSTEHGILDSELILEHVHPTLRGYFLLADAFFQAMTDDKLLGPPVAAVDQEQAWREIPVSEVDRLFGEYKVALVKANWPFTSTPGRPQPPSPGSEAERLAQEMFRQTMDWGTAHTQLARHYQSIGDQQSYAKLCLILADAIPFRPQLQFQAGTALIEIGRERQAINYLYRAAQLAPRDINTLLALSHAFVLNGARPQAREVLKRVLTLDPTNATALKVLDQLDQ